MSDVVSPVPAVPQSADDFAFPRPARRRLRIWPGVVFVVLQWLAIAIPAWVVPGSMTHFMAMFWAPIVATAGVVGWWLFASRLAWADRWLGLLVFAAGGAATYYLCDPTFRFGLSIFAPPRVTTAWVVWLLVTPFLAWPARRVGVLVAIMLAWGYCTLLRLDGVDGSMSAKLSWRWSTLAEDQFLAEIAGRKSPAVAPDEAKVALQPGDWPGFRGANRDGQLTGVLIETDWKQHPPQKLWRHRIGPGWSSFSVVGKHLYTQEQRGESEAVVCYDTETGEERWAHQDRDRFTEVVGGPGPRATPTFHEGKLYTLGANGKLNCLDAATGKPLWSRDILVDAKVAKVPMWGFASSPLVVQGIVTVFAGGPEGKSVLGYRAGSGDLAWSAGDGLLSYCSPQPARLGGVEQVLIATDAGLTAFDPLAGTVLWQHGWPSASVARIIQPALVAGGDVLVGTGFGLGTRRVHVSRTGSAWADQEVWTTHAIKPYYNDLVLYQGNLYGFDGAFFTCANLDDGKSRWRARGYGSGQVLLLADQGLLLILSEQGDVALLEATPAAHKELARFHAIDGKTWNHPVLAHGKLFVRNGEEVACYRLTEINKK